MIVKAPHPESLLRGSLVSPSLEAAVMNVKYVNAVLLYRQKQEFERYGLHISRQNMANWTRVSEILCLWISMLPWIRVRYVEICCRIFLLILV